MSIGNGTNGGRVYWDTTTRLRIRYRKLDTSYTTSVWLNFGGGLNLYRLATDNALNQYQSKVNNTTVANVTVGGGGFYNDNASASTFGNAGLGAGGSYDGKLYGCIAVNEDLTTDEENELITWANERWGLVIPLT